MIRKAIKKITDLFHACIRQKRKNPESECVQQLAKKIKTTDHVIDLSTGEAEKFMSRGVQSYTDKNLKKFIKGSFIIANHNKYKTLIKGNWLSSLRAGEYIQYLKNTYPQQECIILRLLEFNDDSSQNRITFLAHAKSCKDKKLETPLIVLQPILHINHHYSLLVINPLKEAFEYYTSFINYHTPYLDTIINLLKASFPNLHPNIDMFKFEIVRDIPYQHNSDDCGIYMCYYIEQLLKGNQRENWKISSAKYRHTMLKAIYDSS